MDPKATYWTAAWINMLAVAALGAAGLGRARRGRYGEHRRLMRAGVSLVLLFVASYAIKLWMLGRETLESWDPSFVAVLRLHEASIACMLAGGAIALVQAHRLGLPEAVGKVRADPELSRALRLHRRAGALAVAAALFGVASAAYVLYGMYRRLA